jgi:hypothetical protein
MVNFLVPTRPGERTVSDEREIAYASGQSVVNT